MSFTPKVDRISYAKPQIGLEEVKAVLDVMLGNNGERWTIGPNSVALEQELASVAGVGRAVVVNSGSSALLLSLAALKLPRGSKVIIPACNFPTAFNAIVQNNLIPVVVDVSLATLNLDLDEVAKVVARYPEVKAVVAVNIAGNPVDLIKLRSVVGSRKIILDDCDGFGTLLERKMVEVYADISCASFHAAHIISMGEGGAVFTNDEEIANTVTKMREWGRASGTDKIYSYPGFPTDYKERYVYEEIGYNLKPLELQCALGRIQLRRLEEFRIKRQANYDKLTQIFAKYQEFFTPITCDLNANPCWFSFPVLVHNIERGKVMEYLESKNIECRTIFSGNITRHPAYKDVELEKFGTLVNSDKVMANGMFLSCHPYLTDEMLAFIDQCLLEVCSQ